MLNPDGMIQGNHKTDLAGYDMNRQWLKAYSWLHLVIYSVKNLTTILNEERPIDAFCDIHGNFLTYNSFMYCCRYNKGQDQGINKRDTDNDVTLRIMPYLLSNKNEYFSMKNCSFNMETHKVDSTR